ncbi:MAG: hypothetical protein CBC13_03655 [Planctomycetia bacterium TMED53]|nr:MAG: hypothetical protein CBC13_03655 [Planctomycetia bacterium TMED53]
MKIGRKILNLRRDRGVAQRSLAEMTSVTPSALSRIEAGIHQPKGPVALRIARVLGVSADYILDESAPYPPPIEALLEAEIPSESMVEENLTAKEKELVDSYRTLGPEEKVAFRDILNAFNQDFGELKNFINKSGLLDPENKKAR